MNRLTLENAIVTAVNTALNPTVLNVQRVLDFEDWFTAAVNQDMPAILTKITLIQGTSNFMYYGDVTIEVRFLHIKDDSNVTTLEGYKTTVLSYFADHNISGLNAKVLFTGESTYQVRGNFMYVSQFYQTQLIA